MARSIQINERVKVNPRHWKCAGEEGCVVAFDGAKVNKYLVRFQREVQGTLDSRELWLGEQDIQEAD